MQGQADIRSGEKRLEIASVLKHFLFVSSSALIFPRLDTIDSALLRPHVANQIISM